MNASKHLALVPGADEVQFSRGFDDLRATNDGTERGGSGRRTFSHSAGVSSLADDAGVAPRLKQMLFKGASMKRIDLRNGFEWFLGAASAVAMAVAMHPGWRSAVREKALPEYRSAVSTARATFAAGLGSFTVAKVKTRDALWIEVYKNQSEGHVRLVDKIQLADVRDGYFNFNGRATNLAIADLDGDGQPEILAPTFDDDLVGRLSVFKYDPVMRSFQLAVR